MFRTLFSPNDHNYEDETVKTYTSQILAFLVGDVITGKIKSKNKSLNDAAMVIQKIKNKHGGNLDMHAGNIMIRLSPIPQLVITDPLD